MEQKVCYHICKTPLLEPIVKHFNLVYTLILNFPKIHFNNILWCKPKSHILWPKLHIYLTFRNAYYMLCQFHHLNPAILGEGKNLRRKLRDFTSCSATCAMFFIRVSIRCCESCTKHTLLSLKHDSKRKANKIETHSTNKNEHSFYTGCNIHRRRTCSILWVSCASGKICSLLFSPVPAWNDKWSA